MAPDRTRRRRPLSTMKPARGYFPVKIVPFAFLLRTGPLGNGQAEPQLRI